MAAYGSQIILFAGVKGLFSGDEAKTAATQVPPLRQTFPAGLSEPSPSLLLYRAGVPASQQSRESTQMASAACQSRLFPRPGPQAASEAMAQSPSWLLAKATIGTKGLRPKYGGFASAEIL